jgi:N-acylneuraminate cytidylyltransferase
MGDGLHGKVKNLVEVLALVPARGGSKSIPRKNIRPFAGHPLIAYSIAAGLAAETVRRVVVSTDDEEIAAIARGYGAETPFLRPAELSQDHTPDLPVFQHALRWLVEHEGYQPEIVVQLRPTSPFRRVRHIDEAVRILAEHPEADSVRTVCVPFQNPFKMWRIDTDGFMRPLIADVEMVTSTGEGERADEGTHAGVPLHVEPYNMPRQMLPDVYWQTGYVDAARAGTILTKDSMTGERILPLVIDPSEWIDIDSPDDWRRAERLLESGEVTFEELGFSIEIRE